MHFFAADLFSQKLDIVNCAIYLLVGTLMGITNMIGTIPGFVGPSVVGALTYRNVSALLDLLNLSSHH